jgi:hypothetical protein
MSGPFQDLEKIVLNRDGVFLSNGEPITHEGTVEAFHRFLRKDSQGYFIEIGRDSKRIEVEDTARFVREISWFGNDHHERIELTLMDGAQESLNVTTLSFRPERLTCRVKGATEEAKFLRKPYLEFLMRTEQEDGKLWIRLGGRRYVIPSVEHEIG